MTCSEHSGVRYTFIKLERRRPTKGQAAEAKFPWRGRRIAYRRQSSTEVEFIAECEIRIGNESPTELAAGCRLR
jgi:hypothetical protein